MDETLFFLACNEVTKRKETVNDLFLLIFATTGLAGLLQSVRFIQTS